MDKTHLIAQTHIDSFNFAMKEGLSKLCEYLLPCEIELEEDKTYKLQIEFLNLGYPRKISQNEVYSKEHRLFPTEARLRGISYSAPLVASVVSYINQVHTGKFDVNLGNIPIMVKSNNCHLAKHSLEELWSLGEDYQEIGGYFIINGVEKLIRLLILPKQNYPIAMYRPSFLKRGVKYSPYGLMIRCIREDLFTQTVTLHYLVDGNCTVAFRLRRAEFIVPAVILIKAFKDITDEEIYTRLVTGKAKQTYIRAEVLIRDRPRFGIHTQEQALEFIGEKCKRNIKVPSSMTEAEIGSLILREHLFVHLNNDTDKLNLLLLMIKKLYSLAEGEIEPEGTDSLSTQEILLPGHLYLNYIKEKIDSAFEIVKTRILKEYKSRGMEKLRDKVFIEEILSRYGQIGKHLENMLATGNIVTRTGIDLLQDKGFSIIAEKLNYARFISHFASVHRGSYFTEMKISSVRKLLPEAWGFMCPVHTPDGAPCGLLNHLASGCKPIAYSKDLPSQKYFPVFESCGLKLIEKNKVFDWEENEIPVVLDGRLIGFTNRPEEFEKSLRLKKCMKKIWRYLEIAYLPSAPLFPGIFIFSKEGRLMREVKNLTTQKSEWIGPLEQLNLSIPCVEEETTEKSTHIEVSPLNVLSLLAITTPFSDHNQSPRNMYQCQMAKQTMGTSMYNYTYRTDNKIYRLVTPQKPIVTTEAEQYTQFGFEDYPSGTNAVVAVISYTGFDMEDAMIVNKSSYERGLAHGLVYKTNAKEINDKKGPRYKLVSGMSSKLAQDKGLEKDGLKGIGDFLGYSDIEIALFNTTEDTLKYFSYKDTENCRLENILLVGNTENLEGFKIVSKYRYSRNPTVGDKFSSRHGQKGVLSILWPQEDMPFTSEGITPDIIINPHAFPSRMTIGMLIESMAGKSGASLGKFQESAPFQTTDKLKTFGKELVKAGYSYYGSEKMYSGIFGTELEAEIFIGAVYYERLRHMVSDKFQARSTGPVDILTKQPIKGRKRHGGIRLGEMERDSLIAHGAAFWLYDRLMKSSDYSEGFLCKVCGSILSCFYSTETDSIECQICKVEGVKVAIPYVLRYLTNELAAMNVKLTFK